MTKPTFTPGPWQTKDDYTIDGRTTVIANVDGESFSDGSTSSSFDTVAVCEDEFGERLPNARANARAIAALPDLVAALEEARETVLIASRVSPLTATLQMIDAALAKVCGQ